MTKKIDKDKYKDNNKDNGKDKEKDKDILRTPPKSNPLTFETFVQSNKKT